MNIPPPTVYLKNYAPPPFLIPEVDLDIDFVNEQQAIVVAKLVVRRNREAARPAAELKLDVDEILVESVAVDGRTLEPRGFVLDERYLTLTGVPDEFTLITTSRIDPKQNSKLMGLYASKAGFFTQCEAEGFRRITYFIDRPDVMAATRPRSTRTRSRYPVLLSNGNPVAQGKSAGGGRHWAKWVDPFPEAVLSVRHGGGEARPARGHASMTRSGRKAQLQIYVEPGKLDQAGFAMQALKKAMNWDEQTFGLELDLDQYMIVAVGDFNMGAMENKGLNIFNTKYVLARPDTATDTDYQNIDRVVAHEYFHNWTGNRVTCRDWFQLSLKEGLTVFRDQEFGADMYSRPVQRIQEVRGVARRASSPRTRGRWRIRCARSRTSRSATSTRRPSTRRAPRSCA